MESASSEWHPEPEPGDGPKYLTVLNTLERDIRNGTLAPNERLPPQRMLASHFGVTISTITKAITEATRRGLVQATPGSGTYVAPAESAATRARAFVEMGINLLPYRQCEDLLSASLTGYSATNRSAELLGYSRYRMGPDEGGRKFVNWLYGQGYGVASGTILACHGTQQGLEAALRCVAAPGDTVICEAQAYTGVLRAVDQLGLRPHGVAMDAEGVLTEALDRALAETGAKTVVLTPTAQNPTGSTMSPERRAAIAGLLRRHDVWLIEDAVAAPLTGIDHFSITGLCPDRGIYLTGASKLVAPGIRFGLIVAPDVLAPRLEAALAITNWTGPSYFGGFLDFLVETGQIDRIVARYRKDAAARQALARRYLGGPKAPSIAYHVWHVLPAHATADAFVGEAAAANIHLSVATPFCCPNVAVPNAVRLCLGAEPDVATLEEGLQRLAALQSAPRFFAAPII